jgi:hypothetical protein
MFGRFLTCVLNSPDADDLSRTRAPIAFDRAWAVLTGENIVRILGRDVDRDHWAAAECVDTDGQGAKREESKDHLGKKPCRLCPTGLDHSVASVASALREHTASPALVHRAAAGLVKGWPQS